MAGSQPAEDGADRAVREVKHSLLLHSRSRIQNKQDLDLERDPALRHSPAIMHQQSGFLGINHAPSNKQASSPELQGMQR